MTFEIEDQAGELLHRRHRWPPLDLHQVQMASALRSRTTGHAYADHHEATWPPYTRLAAHPGIRRTRTVRPVEPESDEPEGKRRPESRVGSEPVDGAHAGRVALLEELQRVPDVSKNIRRRRNRRRESQSDTGLPVGTRRFRGRELTGLQRSNDWGGGRPAAPLDRDSTDVTTRSKLLEIRVWEPSFPRVPGGGLRPNHGKAISRSAAPATTRRRIGLDIRISLIVPIGRRFVAGHLALNGQVPRTGGSTGPVHAQGQKAAIGERQGREPSASPDRETTDQRRDGSRDDDGSPPQPRSQAGRCRDSRRAASRKLSRRDSAGRTRERPRRQGPSATWTSRTGCAKSKGPAPHPPARPRTDAPQPDPRDTPEESA